MKTVLCVLGLLIVSSAASGASKPFVWPNGEKAAVSLAYDDAVNSQLDHAIPSLNRYGLKGSFYLILSSETVLNRLPEWRAAATQGHELANHTLFHQCSRKPAGREWVPSENDLDQTSVAQLVAQIRVGNSMLHAIDGKTERTFTTPCGDLYAKGENYLPAIKGDFVAIKSAFGGVTPDMSTLDLYAVGVTTPSEVTGEQLIALVKEAGERGTMVNFTFHGVGGDHLAVSRQAHDALLKYLADHQSDYWTDTFLNIAKYVKKQQSR